MYVIGIYYVMFGIGSENNVLIFSNVMKIKYKIKRKLKKVFYIVLNPIIRKYFGDTSSEVMILDCPDGCVLFKMNLNCSHIKEFNI